MAESGSIRRSEDRFLDQSLAVIPVGKSESKIDQWYNECKTALLPNEKEMKLLHAESTNSEKYRLAYKWSRQIKKYVPGLTKAECRAVTMYTLDTPADYYNEFNDDCRNGKWKKHKVFSALLFSACVKLSKIYPIKSHEVFYRGLKCSAGPPPCGSFFWPQFTSTSKSLKVASKFGAKTIVSFSSCSLGAKISALSAYECEEEMLVLPFEAFVYTHTKDKIVCFERCVKQVLTEKTRELEEDLDTSSSSESDDDNIDDVMRKIIGASNVDSSNGIDDVMQKLINSTKL